MRIVSLLASTKADLEKAMSYDGLEKINVKVIDLAYARRGATLAGYEVGETNNVTRGMPNKVIGARIGAFERTIKVHRDWVMARVTTRSLAELPRITERLDLTK
jgi:FixJ family two-component response regulator